MLNKCISWRKKSALAALIAGAFAWQAPQAKATNYWWDGGTINLVEAGDSVSAGGDGNWDTLLTNWDDGTNHVAWPTIGTDNDAIFGGNAGTITLANIAANDLSFNTAGYTLAGGILTLNGTNSNISTVAGTTTISSELAGSANLVKSGAGLLSVGNANSYTGTTTIAAGTLQTDSILVVDGVSGLGNSTSALVLGGATTQGTLNYTGGATTYIRGFAINAGGGRLTNAGSTGTLTITPASAGISLANGGLTIEPTSQSITIGSVTQSTNPFTGTGTLTKAGTGTLTLSVMGATKITTAAMPINLQAGTLAITTTNVTNTGILGTGMVTIVPGATAPILTYDLSGATASTNTNPFTIANAAGTATIQTTSGGMAHSGAVTFAAGANTPTLQLINTNATTATLRFTGGITGPGNLRMSVNGAGAPITIATGTVNNAGTILADGTGTATGTISAPIGINVGNISTTGISPFTVSGSITLGGDRTYNSGSASGLFTLGAITGTATTGNTQTVTFSATAAGGITSSGIIGNGANGGTVAVIVNSSGTGVTTFSSANTFSGGLSILGGNLTTSTSAAALGTGTVLLGDTTGTNSATLSTGVTALTFANPITVQGGSSGTKTLAITGSAAVTYAGPVTLNGNLALASSSAARLTLSGLIGGAGSITVSGSGSGGDFNITQQNTYAGGTTISTGGIIPVSASSTGPVGSLTSGPLGTGTLLLNGGQMRPGTSAAFTLGNPVTLQADSSFAGNTSEKSLVFSGPMTITGGTRTLTSTVGGFVAGTTVQFDGVIGDGGQGYGFTKAGFGNLTFNASNTYTGVTTITGGQLILTPAGSLANPTVTAQTGGTLTFSGNKTFGGTTSPLITLGGNSTPSTSGGLSLADGGVNTLTINTATPATPALVIGDVAGKSANLTFDVGATADQIVLGSGVQATINAGGARVNIVGLGGLNGTTQTLLISPTTDLTAGGAFTLGTVTGNTSNMLLSLNTTANAIQLVQTPNLSPAPADVYFRGSLSGNWAQTAGSNATNNFTTDASGGVAATQLPGSSTVVHFYALGTTTGNLATSLNQNFTIDSLISESTATTAASIAAGTPAGTLTLAPANSVNGIKLNTSAGALTISAPLVLGADQTWTTAAQTLTVSGGITGAKNLALKTTSGTISIIGSNSATTLTFTPTGAGSLTVTDNTVTGPAGDFMVAKNGLGEGTVTLGGGTLRLRANGNGTSAAQTITFNNPLVITASSTINADYFSSAGGNGKILAFPTTSVGGVTVSASGGSHNYSVGLGNVTLNSTASSTTTFAPGTTVFQRANDVTGSATVGNTNTLVLGGTNTSAGSTISGVISDSSSGGKVALTLNTVGVWSLSGSASNTYTGLTTVAKTTTNGGLTLAKTGGAVAIACDLTIGDATATEAHVILGGDQQFGPAANVVFNGVSNGWAFLQLRGYDLTLNSISEANAGFGIIETREGSGTFGLSTLTLNVASGTQTYRGFFRDSSAGLDETNSLGLVKTGAGTLQWGTANNGTGSSGTTSTLSNTSRQYSGGTIIQNGTLQLLGDGFTQPISLVGAGNVTIDGGATFAGTLDLNGTTTGITGLNGSTGAVLGRIVNNLTASNAVLTIGNNNNSGSFAGVIADNNTGTGTVAITKIGTGTQTLTGINTYTGATTITEGTLALRGNGSIAGSDVKLGTATFSILKNGTGNNGTLAVGTNINVIATGATINVDNNGSNTGNTVAFGVLSAPASSTANTINFTAANGYSMSFSGLALNGSTGQVTTLFPTTTRLTIAGDVTNPMSGFTSLKFDTLDLSGTSGTTAAPNIIAGNILDAPTGGFTPTLLGGYTKVLKTGTGVWQLNGAASNYTGSTTVNTGILQAGINNAIPLVNLQGINVTSTLAGTALYDLNGFNQTLNTVNDSGTALTLGGSTATSVANITGTGSTLTLNGGVTYTATNNPLGSTIAVSTLDLGGGNRNFNIGDSTSTAIELTVTANLSNGSLTKSGAGVLSLPGNVNLTSVFAAAGTLVLQPTTNLNSTSIAMTGGTLDLGETSLDTSRLTLNSGLIINGSLTGSALLKQGPGTLTLGVPVNTGSATAVTINQGLGSANSNPHTNSTLALNFYTAGAPTTFFEPGSTLTFGGPANSLTGGGQFNLLGKDAATNTQNFSSTLVDGGASSIVATNGTTGIVNLGLGTLRRNTGGTLNIVLPATGAVTQAAPGPAGTLLLSASGTAYATFGGNDWAANNADTAGKITGALTAGVGGTSLYTTSNSAATFSGHANITGSFTAASDSTVDSIRFNLNSLVLTLAGTNTITSGGILFGSGAALNPTITGGTIIPGAGRELVFTSNKTSTATIGSVLADNGVNPTTVTYGGSAGTTFSLQVNNTYTGATYITNGRVQSTGIPITTPFGVGANAIIYIDGNQNGQYYQTTHAQIPNPFVIIGNGFNENGTRRGVLRLDSSLTNTPALLGQITLLGDAKVYNNSAITNAGTAVISGNIVTSNAQGATSFALTKDGTGQLLLTGNNSQTATNINDGWLAINSDAALGLPNAPLTFNATSTLQFQTGATLDPARNIVLAAGTTTLMTSPNNTNVSSSEIRGIISGPSELIKDVTSYISNPASNLTLSGVNTFTGNVTIDGGSLTATNSSSLGTGTKLVKISNNTSAAPQLILDPAAGATPLVGIDLPATISFEIGARVDVFANKSGNNIIRGPIDVVSSSGGSLSVSADGGKLTLAGNITPSVSSKTVLRGNAIGEISGVIGGSTADMMVIRDSGTGTWILSGANAYTGSTTATTGTIKLGNPGALGTSVNTTGKNVDNGTIIAAGGALDLGGQNNVLENIRIAGTGVGGTGALTNTGADASIGQGNLSGISGIRVVGQVGFVMTTGNVLAFTGGGGTGAAGTLDASIMSDSLTFVSTGTKLYSTAPSVKITGGKGANATAYIGGVAPGTFEISYGTQRYSVAPNVKIGGITGTGATAVAILDANGAIVGIDVTNPGKNYSGNPTISFSGGTVLVPGTLTTGSGRSRFLVTHVSLTSGGSDFTTTPVVSFTGGTVAVQGTDPVVVGNNSNFFLRSVTITDSGSGYTSPPTVVMPEGSPTTITTAIAGVEMTANSSIGGTGNITLNGPLTGGSFAMTKVGSNTLTLNSVNTYTGNTFVSQGKLLVNGSLSSGTVNVFGGATLGGSGTIQGLANLANTAIVAPGNSTGNLTFGAGLNLSAGGVYNWELGALSTDGTTPGQFFDMLTLSGGNLRLGGTSALTLDLGLVGANGPNSANAFWATNQTWKIVDVDGNASNTGNTNLSTITNAAYTNGSFTTVVGSGADAGDIFLVFTSSVVGGTSIWQGTDSAPWTAAASWTGTIPNNVLVEAKFVTTGGTTANFDADQTVNKLTFDATAPHTISGANKLTLAGTTPSINTAETNTATQTVAVNLDLAAGTTIVVNGGTLELNSPANATLGANVTATVANGATLRLGGAGNALSNGTATHVNVTNNGTLAATTASKRVGNIDGTGTTSVATSGATLTANHIRQNGLTIGAGNTVTLAMNGGDSGTSVVTNLSIDTTGKLDLNDNDLIVDNGNLATLTSKLASGLDINGSYGNGPGITSTAFASNPNFNTVLGIAPNSDLGYASFSGQTVDANDVLIKYTYYGDADLNGVVDSATDFDLYITGLTSGGGFGGWLYGDFDYNGTVDSATDFDLYITGLTSQDAPLLTAGGSGSLIMAIPEPSIWVMGCLGMTGVAAWRRRKRRSSAE